MEEDADALSLHGLNLWQEEIEQLQDTLRREVGRLLGEKEGEEGDSATTLREYIGTMLLENRKPVGAVKAALSDLVGQEAAGALAAWLAEYVRDLIETHAGEEEMGGGGGQGQQGQGDDDDDGGMWEEVPQPEEEEEEEEEEESTAHGHPMPSARAAATAPRANSNGGNASRLFASALAASVRSSAMPAAIVTHRAPLPPPPPPPQRQQQGYANGRKAEAVGGRRVHRRREERRNGSVGARVVTWEYEEEEEEEPEVGYVRTVSLVQEDEGARYRGGRPSKRAFAAPASSLIFTPQQRQQQRRRWQGGNGPSPPVFHVTGFDTDKEQGEQAQQPQPPLKSTSGNRSPPSNINDPPRPPPVRNGGGYVPRGGGGYGYGPIPTRGGRGGGRGFRGFHPYKRPHSFPVSGGRGKPVVFGNKSLVVNPPKSPAAVGATTNGGGGGHHHAPPVPGLFSSPSPTSAPMGRAKSPVGASASPFPVLPPKHRALVRDPLTGQMVPPTKNKCWINPSLVANKGEAPGSNGSGGGGAATQTVS